MFLRMMDKLRTGWSMLRKFMMEEARIGINSYLILFSLTLRCHKQLQGSPHLNCCMEKQCRDP